MFFFKLLELIEVFLEISIKRITYKLSNILLKPGRSSINSFIIKMSIFSIELDCSRLKIK